jgi:cell division protease FtsH
MMLFSIGGLAIMTLRKGGVGGTLNSFGKSNARLLTDKMPPVTFADVAGVEEAKLELQEIVQFLREPGRFRCLGARAPKGTARRAARHGQDAAGEGRHGESGVLFFSISA